MAGITLAQAEAKLSAWMAAEEQIATSGQSVSIDGDSYTRADLSMIAQRISYWENKVKALTRGGIRIRGISPYAG